MCVNCHEPVLNILYKTVIVCSQHSLCNAVVVETKRLVLVLYFVYQIFWSRILKIVGNSVQKIVFSYYKFMCACVLFLVGHVLMHFDTLNIFHLYPTSLGWLHISTQAS